MTHAIALTGQLFHAVRETLERSGQAIGAFFYGDAKRTRYSIAFAYACLSVYFIAVINAPAMGACVAH